MNSKCTLEKILTHLEDGALYDIQKELSSGIVPATGASHIFCRRVNRMIDQGKLCINPTTYRKVYLPTMAKAVQKELADRYVKLIDTTSVCIPKQSMQISLDDAIISIQVEEHANGNKVD